MFYRAFRAVTALALRLFFRVGEPVDPHRTLGLDGPVMYLGNHPNGLIDPGILFVLVRRHVTFLAKEPLFRMPVLGQILRGLDALPVFRKQDGPGDTSKNEGTLTASVEALVAGRAITLFPEGKSHSEPQLAALKTGAARIALEAARRGAPVKIVPVGITYSAKNRFKSAVHVEAAAPIEATGFLAGDDGHEAARRLTATIADALRAVTLNLEAWEDLPVLETAEALYALEAGGQAGDPERQKAFARGMALLRDEQPERYERLKQQLASFRGRLELLRVTPDDLTSRYRPSTVAWFVLRNLLWLGGLPLFFVGMAAFAVPYYLPALAVRAAKPEADLESTVKVLTLLLLAPAWWALLAALGAWAGGAGFGLFTLVAVPPLALFTRYYFERRTGALRDARTFFVLMSKRGLKARLLAEGQGIAGEVKALADELKPRVAA
jgi:1-acyl-sn-glycerol-3-phosphate acyltransferase